MSDTDAAALHLYRRGMETCANCRNVRRNHAPLENGRHKCTTMPGYFEKLELPSVRFSKFFGGKP